jgi:hypothetical protein
MIASKTATPSNKPIGNPLAISPVINAMVPTIPNKEPTWSSQIYSKI